MLEKKVLKFETERYRKRYHKYNLSVPIFFSLSVINYIISVMHFFLQFNGTATHPRLSVFCSDKQLYAMLVDDQNKKCLFYGSTLQKSFRENPPCSTAVSNPHHFWDILYETVKTKQLSLHYTLAIGFFLKIRWNIVLGSCSTCWGGSCQSLCWSQHKWNIILRSQWIRSWRKAKCLWDCHFQLWILA